MVRYKRQERVIWRKASFLEAKNSGKIRHWGQEGGTCYHTAVLLPRRHWY